MFGGMSLFDALCHTFGTMATGGFSTKNASIGHFDSVYIDMVICCFMFLAGTNFALHYRALRGNVKSYFQDTEFKFYCTVIAVSITLISWNTIRFQVDGDVPYDSMWTSLRYAAFQVMSIITTTGYGTADFEQLARALPIHLGNADVLRGLRRFYCRWDEAGPVSPTY